MTLTINISYIIISIHYKYFFISILSGFTWKLINFNNFKLETNMIYLKNE